MGIIADITKMNETPKGHYPPENGWEPRTWYRAECSMRQGNPIFEAIVFSGFLNGKNHGPGGYSGVFASNTAPTEPYDDVWPIETCRYLKIKEKLFTAR